MPSIQKELFPNTAQNPKATPAKAATLPFPALPARAKKAAAAPKIAKLEKKASKSKNVTTLSERVLNKGQKVNPEIKFIVLEPKI